MSTIKVEKNVPMPPGAVTGLSDALRSMAPGDSFLYPLRKRNSLAPTADRVGVKIMTRTDPNDPSMVRVWKVS